MSEQLTSLEIEQWRRTVFERSAWFHAEVLRALEYMLQLHDERERRRKLQRHDVTEQQRTEWLAAPWVFTNCSEMQRDMIAAAVRVMLASRDKTA